MDDPRKIAEKRRRQIETFQRNGMFISRDLLKTVKLVMSEKGMNKGGLQILGDTLGNGVRTADPGLNIGVKINLPTVQEFDMFWIAVRKIRQKDGKISKERE